MQKKDKKQDSKSIVESSATELEEKIISQEEGIMTVYENEPNYKVPSKDRVYKYHLEATNEVIYLNLHDLKLVRQSYWEERKDREMKDRCRIVSPKTGKVIVCRGNCSECDKYRDNHILNLDDLKDSYGRPVEVADTSKTPMELYILQEFYDKFFEYVNEFDELDKNICILAFVEEMGVTEIANKLNKPKQTISYRLDKCRKILVSLLEPYRP